MGTDWRVEERLREKLALLSQELSETQAALDAVRADLAASGAMSDPLKVKCPYCAAKPDYACTSAYDYRVVRTHAARIARAAIAAEEGK